MESVLTPELEADRKRISEGLLEILTKNMPSDMDAGKVEDRAAMVAMFCGTTRTSVMAAAVHVAFYASFTGIDLADVKKFYDEVSELLKDSPYVAEVRKKYDEANLNAKVAAASQAGPVILSPGNDKVH